MYQLGLPDAAWANAIVFTFGVVLLVVTYRFVVLGVGEAEPAVAAPPTPDGGFDERDDPTTERYDTRKDFAENHELRDRETIID